MIDNYDCFTYNLVQYFGELGAEVEVFRNDEITLERCSRAAAASSDRLVISPGPCSPAEAGISVAAIQHFAGKLPILGVCLGHQSHRRGVRRQDRARAAADARQDQRHHHHAGRRVRRAARSSSPSTATTRWRSSASTCPDALEVTAWTDDGEIMGVRHTDAGTMRGRAVPPRVHPDRARPRDAEELPGAVTDVCMSS